MSGMLVYPFICLENNSSCYNIISCCGGCAGLNLSTSCWTVGQMWSLLLQLCVSGEFASLMNSNEVYFSYDAMADDGCVVVLHHSYQPGWIQGPRFWDCETFISVKLLIQSMSQKSFGLPHWVQRVCSNVTLHHTSVTHMILQQLEQTRRKSLRDPWRHNQSEQADT